MKIIGPSNEIFEPISDTHLLDDVPTSVSVNCHVSLRKSRDGNILAVLNTNLWVEKLNNLH